MLNEFLKVAYAQETRRQSQQELMGLLDGLPISELRKIASSGVMDDAQFLDRFKGTPLFDQALALEQEEIQAEMLAQERQEQQRNEPSPWEMKNKINLKKKLLEVELAKMDAQPAVAQPAQGAGAPGPVPAEGVQDDSQGLGGGVAKVASVKRAFADTFGRELARLDFEKAAHARSLTEYGVRAGAVMAQMQKHAGPFDFAGLATKAVNWGMKNPAAAGAAIGSGIGAVSGAMNSEKGHRLSGALGGAAVGGAAGGALGHAGMGIGKRLARGQDMSSALTGYGTQVKRQLAVAPRRISRTFNSFMTPAAAAAPAAV